MYINNNLDKDKVFFTSDTHFGHRAIIDFCGRPFFSVSEMEEKLVSNWNKVVFDDDTVFHLGDFAFGGLPYWERVRSRLNGHIVLVIGNHDRRQNLRNSTRFQDLFDATELEIVLNIDGQPIILNHYPLLCYSGSFDHKIWNLHGHVHSGPGCNGKDTSRLEYRFPTQYDVGVDNNNYRPISFNQVREIINQQIDERNKEKSKILQRECGEGLFMESV